jgi:hypothetical protein
MDILSCFQEYEFFSYYTCHWNTLDLYLMETYYKASNIVLDLMTIYLLFHLNCDGNTFQIMVIYMFI